MEGYTNVIGTAYDFDDLDIEGRVVDEWSAEAEENSSSKFKNQKDERTILSARVKLDNGKQVDVFSSAKKNGVVYYSCRVCTANMVGLAALRDHADSSKHRNNVSKPIHPKAKFMVLDPKENVSLEPGEPMPPGLEEMIIQSCNIQPRLDNCKTPLIGIEYLVELTQSPLDEDHYYICLLCDKTGGERNIFIHLTSLFHYMKYLSIFFPTVARKLSTLPNKKFKKSFGNLVTEIVKDIEEKYGRSQPISETHSNFYAQGRKAQLEILVNERPHIKEKEGALFDEKATQEYLDIKCKEVASAPPQTGRSEPIPATAETKDSGSSLFNKSGRVNIDKKQLRPRDNEKASSPDVQIVDVQLPKPPEKKKRSRSGSLSSISTISSSRSGSRSRFNRHGANRSRKRSPLRSRRHWSRSRSRSPGYRGRRHPSPYNRGRDRSPPRRWNRSWRDRTPDSYKHKEKVDRYGRTRESEDKSDRHHHRDRSNEGRESPKEVRISSEEKLRWEKFREEITNIETVKLEKLKFHEKNPEQHPHYPEEWKSFWNRRYNELQRSGVDPSKHDFKPEWISFWTKRMKELYEEDLGKAKQELKQKFNLPEDPNESDRMMPWKNNSRKRRNSSPGLVDISPPTPDRKDAMANIRTTWKALTGSDIKDTPKRPLSPWEEDGGTRDMGHPMKRDMRSQSPTDKLLEDMPQRKSRTSSLIFVLRKLTVLEHQLGSLVPKIFEMMSQSLALEKLKEDASLDLLFEEDNCVFLETVREKLIALLCAGVVPKNMVNTSRSAIKHIDICLFLASKRERALPIESVRSTMGFPPPYHNLNATPSQYVPPPPKPEPVLVPGVGQIDRAAIAMQIAAALCEQGKDNVTEAELAQLVNAVVGMAEASAHSAQPMTTANFLTQLQAMQIRTTTTPSVPVQPTPVPAPERSVPQSNVSTSGIPATSANTQQQASVGGLTLLQSAYNDSAKADQESPKPEPKRITDEELAATLSTFNKLEKENQPAFIQKLQTTNPEMHKRLRPFVSATVYEASDRSKRSPITISISKDRSEQKIKPLASGRLSPFSSRTGGVNPTIGEHVVIDDDDDDKNDVKVISDSPPKHQPLQGHKDFSKHKSNIEDDYSEDDDDYTFEDVYKAAQEKLRQRQLEKESLARIEMQKINAKETSMVQETAKAPVSAEESGNKIPSLSNEIRQIKEKGFPPSRDGVQLKNQIKEDDFMMEKPIQHSLQSVDNGFGKTPVFTTSNHTLTGQQPTLQETTRMPQQANSFVEAQPFEAGNSQTDYQNREQYSNEPIHPEDNARFYNKSGGYPPPPAYLGDGEQYQNPPRDPYSDSYPESSVYPGNKDPYSNPPRDPYGGSYPQSSGYSDAADTYAAPSRDPNPVPTSYRDPYNPPYTTETNRGYENQASSYDDQFRYRSAQENYPQGRPPPQGSYPQARPPPQGSYPQARPLPQENYPQARPHPQENYPQARPHPQENYPQARPPPLDNYSQVQPPLPQDNYPQARHIPQAGYPNYPASSQRYPSSGYPY